MFEIYLPQSLCVGVANMLANKFATMRFGKIVAVTEAMPPHELLVNQFEITDAEFDLLRSVRSLDSSIDSLQYIHILAEELENKRVRTIKAIHDN